MNPARRRLFVLLGAYEDMTDRETSALRRGDVDYVLAIQERKARLTESLTEARRATDLSSEENAAFRERLSTLQSRETDNLGVLRAHMVRVRQSLDEIGHAMQRSRKVRRGYSGVGAGLQATVASVLGQA